MKIHGFRSACSCLYSKGRCGWSFSWRWLPRQVFTRDSTRWLHHLQTHNGNAGRNSKRLQRSSERKPSKFKLEILNLMSQLSKRCRIRKKWRGCGCRDLTGNQAPRHRKVNERGGFVPLQVLLWILKIAQHNWMQGKNKIFWFMSEASGCLLVRYCGDVVIWQPQSTAGPRRPGWKWRNNRRCQGFFETDFLFWYLEKMTYFVCKRIATTSKMITHSIGFVFYIIAKCQLVDLQVPARRRRSNFDWWWQRVCRGKATLLLRDMTWCYF